MRKVPTYTKKWYRTRVFYILLLLLILFYVAVGWFFSDTDQEMLDVIQPASESSEPTLDNPETDMQAFQTLPAQPEPSASISEHADYAVKSTAYWCGQLAGALKHKSTSKVNDLLRKTSVHLKARISNLDQYRTKIKEFEDTINTNLVVSLETRRKRMMEIESLKQQLFQVESYLTKVDILLDDIRNDSPGQEQASDENLSELQMLMQSAVPIIQWDLLFMY